MSDEPATSRSDATAAPVLDPQAAPLPDPPDPSGESPTAPGATGPPTVTKDAGPPTEPVDLDTATRAALLSLPGRIAQPATCPFLRAGPGAGRPDNAGRFWCEAAEPAVGVGDRQRQLLCQVAAHPTCPRYVRGEAALRASLAPGLRRRRRGGPLAIGTALVLLLAAAAVALTSGLGPSGGGAASSPTALAGGPAEPIASPRGTAESGGAPSGPPATVAPVPTVAPTLVATRDLPAAWRRLEPCPAPDVCYLYTVRRSDTLSSIAARFETTVRRLRRLNPSLTAGSTIRPRQELRVPPPPD